MRGRATLVPAPAALTCALAVLAVASCTYDPAIPAGRFQCETDADCPRGFLCVAVPTNKGDLKVCCTQPGCKDEPGPVRFPPSVVPRDGSATEGDGDAAGPQAGHEGGQDTTTGDAEAGDARATTADAAGRDAPSAQVDAPADAPTFTPVDAPGAPGCPTTACAAGETRCGPAGGVETCVLPAGAGRCPEWSPETACAGSRRCSAGRCACPSAPVACTGGPGTFCEEASLVATCALDASGCLAVTTRAGCGTGRACTGTYQPVVKVAG